MAEPVQTYGNHARWLPGFHFFVMPVLLLNFLNEARLLWYLPNIGQVWEVVVAAALVTLGLLSRIQALAVQDRLIRLEMRMRLRQILPPDIVPAIERLTARQLVALRFASDGELPELVREVLAGSLRTSKEIKLRIKDWQGDFLRA